MMPRVSVLMTAYNAAPFLRASIDSIVNQTYADWELIIVDDGSTDATPSIVAKYVDARIRLFSLSKNIGRTPALRYAFTQARGEYIAVLDADDIAKPERLQREVDFLDSHSKAVLVGSWTEHIDEKGCVLGMWTPPTKTDQLRDLMGRLNPIVHSSAMFRRDKAVLVGGYPEQYVYAQDFALILALAGQGEIAVIDHCLCQLRISAGSMTRSGQYDLDFAREEFTLLRHAGRTLSLNLKGRVINWLKVRKCQIRYGLCLLLNRSCNRVIKI